MSSQADVKMLPNNEIDCAIEVKPSVPANSVIPRINCLRFPWRRSRAINESISPRGNLMYQPKKQASQSLQSRRLQARNVDRLFNTLRELDRTVVEISMEIYNVPRRDRAVMLKLHRRLHDTIRQGHFR